MELKTFNEQELGIVHTAVDIAEDATADHFRFSSSEWNRIRYDIKTLAHLNEDEITHQAFAQLFKYSRDPHIPPLPHRVLDFYLICLQDHIILEALAREPRLTLLGICLYILTHELVHVVRFSKYYKRYECSDEEREREESVVHHLTYDILKKLNWREMEYILHSYTEFRNTDRIVV